MVSDKRWLLPDGIDELLPEQAAAVEALRRALLDDCAGWGYRYVIPPWWSSPTPCWWDWVPILMY